MFLRYESSETKILIWRSVFVGKNTTVSCVWMSLSWLRQHESLLLLKLPHNTDKCSHKSELCPKYYLCNIFWTFLCVWLQRCFYIFCISFVFIFSLVVLLCLLYPLRILISCSSFIQGCIRKFTYRLSTWRENGKWYNSLPLGAIVSLFRESV